MNATQDLNEEAKRALKNQHPHLSGLLTMIWPRAQGASSATSGITWIIFGSECDNRPLNSSLLAAQRPISHKFAAFFEKVVE
jgi:hypothetical protein